MKKINAFPTLRQIEHPHGSFVTNESGMTLRDYFAAKAMEAMLHGITGRENIAKYAYAMADSMMEAREQ